MVVKRALLLSTGDRYFAFLSNFATVAIVSRILTPAEIGVSVIGMAIVGIAMSVREFVSTNFLIQRQNLTREEIQGSFTLISATTVVIAGMLAVIAPQLAVAYDEANLVPYLRVIALCLLVELGSALIVTLMRRDMAFGEVAKVNISGSVVGMIVAIVLSLTGFSYMSFAWAWLATAVTTSLLAIVFRPHFWMFKPSFSNWEGMIRFGRYNGAIVLMYKAYDTLPYLLIGKALSPQSAALFSRSNMICQIPDKAILSGAISVLLPAYSDAARQGRNLKSPYLYALAIITALYWPALIVLVALAYPVVDILLGSQWHGVIPLVRIVALASLFSFSFEMNYPVMVSMDAIKDLFHRALIAFPPSAAVISCAILLGGLEAAAWSMVVIVPFQAFVALTFVRRRLDIRWVEIGAATWRSGIVALTSASGPLAVAAAAGFDFKYSVGQAIVAGMLAAVGWLVGLWATRHPLLEEMAQAIPPVRRALVQVGR